MTSILFGTVRCRCSLIKGNYLKNEKILPKFVFLSWNLHQILDIFKKKKIVIAKLLPNLQTVKNLVTGLSKNRRLRNSFENQHVKASQTIVKSPWKLFYHIFSLLWEEIIQKISRLLKIEILGGFVNRLTADDKCPVWDCENVQFKKKEDRYS